jgi:hypothetical protein
MRGIRCSTLAEIEQEVYIIVPTLPIYCPIAIQLRPITEAVYSKTKLIDRY